MRRLPELALAALPCLLVWGLALESAKGADLLVGLVVVVTVLVSVGAGRAGHIGLFDLVRRTAAFVPFALFVGWQVAQGTWKVALVVLGLKRPRATGIVAVPMEDRSDIGVAVGALVTTLTPGENVVDLDWERRLMLVHTIDAGEPARLRRAERRLYERFQQRVFP